MYAIIKATRLSRENGKIIFKKGVQLSKIAHF